MYKMTFARTTDRALITFYWIGPENIDGFFTSNLKGNFLEIFVDIKRTMMYMIRKKYSPVYGAPETKPVKHKTYVPVESIARTSYRRRRLTRKLHAICAVCDPAGRHITTDDRLACTPNGMPFKRHRSHQSSRPFLTYSTNAEQ